MAGSQEKNEGGPSGPETRARPRSSAFLASGIESRQDFHRYLDAVLLDQNDGLISTAAAKNHIQAALGRLKEIELNIRREALMGTTENMDFLLRKSPPLPNKTKKAA